jgi:type IX secretion system PorP/SprF family membrane protein
MKKLKKIAYLLCAAMAAGSSVNAQDIHFSQFYENAILRNPALTGIFSGDYKAGLNYRSQWNDISVPFQTVLGFAETRVSVNGIGDYLSFGVSATYDKAGTINFNSMQVYPAINFNKAMTGKNNTYLSVGFAAGYIQRSIDLTKATFSSQYTNGNYDPLNPSGDNITNAVVRNYDLAAGISLNSSVGPNNAGNYYIGVSGFHVTKPKQTFNVDETLIRLETKWQTNMGFKYNINEHYSYMLHANYSMQGNYREFIAGGLGGWRPEMIEKFAVYAGLFFRLHDSYIPTVKLEYGRNTIVFSYDVNTSTLRTASNGKGGFEITLYSRGKYNRPSRNGNQVRCPHFEQMMEMESN